MSNPYIDYNLLKSQSQFSLNENRRFEYKHTVSLNSQKSSSIVKKKMFIRFKWNEKLNDKYECDTKHFLYLIYLSLIKVEQRQVFKNKYYVNCNRGERVLKLLDKEEVMTNLISFCNKTTQNNKLDGNLLKNMGTKDFINNILTTNGGKQCTMGWSTKIYAKLVNEITINGINGTVSIPNYKYDKLINDGIVWRDCSIDNVINVLHDAFRRTEKHFITNYQLKNYQNDIIAFWKNQNINGKIIESMSENTLINKTKQCLNEIQLDPKSKKKLQTQINKLINILLTECDLNQIL